MKECDIEGGGVKAYTHPSYIFWGQDPTPSILHPENYYYYYYYYY